MKVRILSSKGYEDKSKDYGDCIIIDNGKEIVVYDCGSEEHANEVMKYMDSRKIEKVKIILSHNDDDHFNGIPILLENEKVSEIYTVLLLKYKDELLDRIDDKRKNRGSIGRQLKEIYSNISDLSGNNLINVEVGTEVAEDIEIVGQDEDYMLDAVAKGLDSREGDTIDGETIANATSIQVSVKLGSKKLLLSGDSTFESMKSKVKDYNIIQLPHHGKLYQAEKIFDLMYTKNNIIYVVSDNTGDTNGGSDDLDTKGHNVKNTKNTSGYIELSEYTSSPAKVGSLGVRLDIWEY